MNNRILLVKIPRMKTYLSNVFITGGSRGHTRSPAVVRQCPNTSSVALHEYVSGHFAPVMLDILHTRQQTPLRYILGLKTQGAVGFDTEWM
jgi:hypothetical protein